MAAEQLKDMTSKFTSCERKDEFQDLAGFQRELDKEINCQSCLFYSINLKRRPFCGQHTSVRVYESWNHLFRERWWRRRRAGEKKEGEALKVKLHADVFLLPVCVPLWWCRQLLPTQASSSANIWASQTSLCLLNVCKKRREAEKDKLHNNVV